MPSSGKNQGRRSLAVGATGPDRALSRGYYGLDEHLDQVLTGSIDISGFRQWFASALREIESEADEDTIEFASLIENRIAEHARGHVPDQVLIATLHADVEERGGIIIPG